MESAAWRIKRLHAISRDGFRCRICNSDKGLVVHHRQYPRELGTEPVEDLTTLCSCCHDLYHKKNKIIKQKRELTPFEKKRKDLKRKKKAATRALKQKASLINEEYFKRIRKY